MSTKVVKPLVVRAGETATFGVDSDVIAPFKYQWKKDGVFIGGSQWKSYTTPPLKPADMSAKWSVVVFGQDYNSEESDPVVLSETQAFTITATPDHISAEEK